MIREARTTPINIMTLATKSRRMQETKRSRSSPSGGRETHVHSSSVGSDARLHHCSRGEGAQGHMNGGRSQDGGASGPRRNIGAMNGVRAV